jgi:hypothetical protein
MSDKYGWISSGLIGYIGSYLLFPTFNIWDEVVTLVICLTGAKLFYMFIDTVK